MPKLRIILDIDGPIDPTTADPGEVASAATDYDFMADTFECTSVVDAEWID